MAGYTAAVGTALVYGLQVLVAMLVAGGILVVISGGSAALGWSKESAPH